jgi:hypothetical protein
MPSLALVVLVACTGADERSSEQALSQTAPEPPTRTSPLGMRPAERAQVLDQRADGSALVGTVLAAPLDGDPERMLSLHVTGAALGALEGRRVLDARFAGDGALTLGIDHVLRYVDARGRETELDAQVEAPLSVVGERVAYARGEMPFFEIARADVRTAEVVALTTDLAPCWSPALSEDGTEVVFASSASGQPTLHRRGANGQIVTLPSSRTPSSPRAPRWSGDRLTFEDEAGTVTIALAAVAP